MRTYKTRPKDSFPRAEDILRIVSDNLLGNLRDGNQAKVHMAPLVQRAYTVVYETGVIPYREYTADTVFLEDVQDG